MQATRWLENWETANSLTALEKSSVALLEDAVSTRPVPIYLLDASQVGSTSRPSTPTQSLGLLKRIGSRLDLQHSPRNASPRQGKLHTSDLERQGPIETTAQFHDWYTTHIEPSIESEQLVQYVDHLHQVQSFVSSCQDMLESLQDMKGYLKELEANYKFVEENSRVLQIACEEMLQEQKHLLEVSESISGRLAYFRELEKATKQLNMPGEAIVLEPNFLELLDRLDQCLEFLKANRNFKDAEIYLIRFQQCLTRSMTLIKIYFVNLIGAMTVDITDKLTGRELSETALHALQYTKFTTKAEEVRLLVYEMEKRALNDADEYASLLGECHETWFASRNALLADTVSEEIKRMEPYTSDLIKLARTGCSYLRSVCVAEWDLFAHVFSSTGESQIHQYLESLCDRLYDFLRPRILHESSLDKLCELCRVLQALIALDPSSEAEEDELVGDFALVTSPLDMPSALQTPKSSYFAQQRSIPTSQATQPAARPLKGLRFARLLLTVLQDTQTRLVFRAQAIVQAEVLHYIPTDNDLDYPAKLHTTRRMSSWLDKNALQELEERGQALQDRLPDAEIQASWYPTLSRTLYVLSKLHTFVNNAIFEDFAGEAVTFCRQSLQTAAARLAQKSNPTPLEAQLFNIRHLLILKEMVASIDLVQIDRAADFSVMTDALSNLLWNTSALLHPSSLFEMASRSIPNFAETMTDAKIDLDTSLKAVCEEYIVQAGVLVAAPIRAFLTRAKTYIAAQSAATNAGADLSAQEWATSEQIISLQQSFLSEGGNLEKSIQELLSQLRLWMSDKQAVSVLTAPIFEEIVETYTEFFNFVKSEYDFSVSSTMLSPTGVRDNIRVIAESAGISQTKK